MSENEGLMIKKLEMKVINGDKTHSKNIFS
jgi:hypothetical protein